MTRPYNMTADRSRDRLSVETATKEGYVPLAGPYRSDTEVDKLTDALVDLRGASIRLVIEESGATENFKGISIWRKEGEVKL